MPKKYVVLLLLSFCTVFANAQQKPHYTQYVLNNYVLNPALSGIENYTDIKIAHRHQWVGLADAPVSTYLTIHSPIGKKDERLTATSFSKTGENMRGKNYWDEYTAAAPHHGIGLQIVNDQTGPFKRLSFMGTYAYHIGLSAKTNLSAGIGLGMNQLNLNTSKLNFGPNYPIDPAVSSSGAIGKSTLDASAGIWLYSDSYFLGVSAQQLVPTKLDFSSGIVKLTEGKLVPHLFLSAGYRFMLNEDVSVLPSVMLKYIQPVPMQKEVNVKIQYQELIWGGATYRFDYGFAAMAGVHVSDAVNVSYAYDYSTTRLNTVSSGTHEIMLGFVIGNKYSTETCPKRIW
ncbi:MAG: type IX secretion system membrane protein PorP/SprF [Ferruginibacter sp.]